MTKKKISLVLIIIIISAVLIFGGTLTWGFLTEWGQKNKSSAPTEIEVDVEIEEEPEKEIKKEIKKDDEAVSKQIKKFKLELSVRDKGEDKQTYWNIGIKLIPTGSKIDINTMKTTASKHFFTLRKSGERSNKFYGIYYSKIVDWNFNCGDQINMVIKPRNKTDKDVFAMVKNVKLTVTFADDTTQIFTDLTVNPTHKYKDINGNTIPLLAQKPTSSLFIEDKYNQLFDTTDATKYTNSLLLPYSNFPTPDSTTYVAPKKWILCNTCNARDHCIKPCKYQSSTEKNWCYLNEDSKGICTPDDNAEQAYTGQDRSPWSYSPCCQKSDCYNDKCKIQKCTDTYNKNWCYLKEDPNGKCKINNAGNNYTGTDGSPYTYSAPCGPCDPGKTESTVIRRGLKARRYTV